MMKQRQEKKNPNIDPDKSTKKLFYKKILTLLTIHLFCLGLVRSPKTPKNISKSKPNISLICFNTIICISSVLQVSSYIFLEPWNNIYIKMEPIQFFCHLVHDVFLYAFLVENRCRILKVLQEIQHNFRGFEGEILREKISDEGKINRQILFPISAVLIAISIAYVSHVGAKLHDSTFLLPTSLKILGENNSDIKNLYYLYYSLQIIQFICGCFSCLLNSAGVTLTIALFVLLGSQYEILQICFENVRNPRMSRLLSPNVNQFRKYKDERREALMFAEGNNNGDDIFEQDKDKKRKFIMLANGNNRDEICERNERREFIMFSEGNNNSDEIFEEDKDERREFMMLANGKNRDEIFEEYILEQNLKICIKYHMYLKEIVADVQKILNSIIFVLFAVCEFMLCLCSFQIFQIYRELSFLQLAKCFSMLTAVLFYEFTSFWYAQQLTIKTEKLFTSIYFSQWYSGSKRYKSCIRIILYNTKNPFILNAGKIVPVTLASFVRSLQAAFSYFNLLRALTEAK
ncbi:uncharacterized protein LOC120351792 [Nilaparvata lugens]|uniref:uncharacterized protein LOC120351792 n=1 Tax=Nilaparvata lugens TaxID=108931 RepID=UPI00193CEB09|nr:uncharacterized protein LOC120351792 [Nilaparvata lugens]